jgi:hypothetical protein
LLFSHYTKTGLDFWLDQPVADHSKWADDIEKAGAIIKKNQGG